MSFGGIGGCATRADGGPWGPLCEGPCHCLLESPLGALAWAWVPPSDSWVIRLTAGLTAVSGLYVAPPGTLPASARPSAAVSLPSEGLGPCLCSKRRYLEVRAGQGGWVAASAVGVSQAW